MMELNMTNLAAISTPSGWNEKSAVRVSDGIKGLEATNQYEVRSVRAWNQRSNADSIVTKF